MEPDQLRDLARRTANRTGHRQVLVLGSQAVPGSLPGRDLPEITTISEEADLAIVNDLTGDTKHEIEAHFGMGSPYHQHFGVYADGITLSEVTLSAGWEGRVLAEEVDDREDPDNPVRQLFPDIHDLCVSKLTVAVTGGFGRPNAGLVRPRRRGLGAVTTRGAGDVTRSRRSSVCSYLDPRVDVYAPTDSFPYYRVEGYDRHDNRVVQTSGGSTLRKAAEMSRQIEREETLVHRERDPTTTAVDDEVELWLDPANHRSRGNKPWSNRHVENMRREWAAANRAAAVEERRGVRAGREAPVDPHPEPSPGLGAGTGQRAEDRSGMPKLRHPLCPEMRVSHE